MAINLSALQQMIQMCQDIDAHAELDFEITLAGNGTNACEAGNVANEILNLLGVAKDAEYWNTVAERVEELENE